MRETASSAAEAARAAARAERDANQSARVLRRLHDARHTRDLHELIPDDAGPYADDIFDILTRMDTGYWPTASIGKGWYPILAQLNADMRDVTDNFSIIDLRREDGALWLSIRVSAQDGHFLKELTSLMTHARARSRCVCEECGALGDEVITNHTKRVLCEAHAAGKGETE